MSWFLASMSPRSMRLARETSCSAVSSGTLPISRRYMRTGSLLAVLMERSSLGAALALGLLVARAGLAGACVVHAVGPDHVDAEVVEGHVDVVDLLGREVDVGEDLEDVLGGEVALLLALVEQHADFLDRAEDRSSGCRSAADSVTDFFSAPCL